MFYGSKIIPPKTIFCANMFSFPRSLCFYPSNFFPLLLPFVSLSFSIPFLSPSLSLINYLLCFLGNDFATTKHFGPKDVWWKFLVQACFRAIDFTIKKHFRPKKFWAYIFVKTLFLLKKFYWKFLCTTVFEEMILQP